MAVQVDYDEPLTELEVWTITSAFGAVLTYFFSFALISQHLNNYVQPNVQTLIVRILFLPPIFVTEAFLSVALVETLWPYFFAVLRDAYEAYVIFLFLSLLITYMGGEDMMLAFHRDQPPRNLGGVIGLISGPLTLNPAFLLRVKRSILQFVYIKPTLAFIEFIMEATGHEAIAGGVDWLRILSLVSLVIAMAALLQFYKLTVVDLESYNPFLKFLCIKLVIFITLVQKFILAQALDSGRIESRPDMSSSEFAHALQGFLVSYEMIAAAFSLHWAFPVQECLDHATSKQPTKAVWKVESGNLCTILNCVDLLHETRDVLCCGSREYENVDKEHLYTQRQSSEQNDNVRMDKFGSNGIVTMEPPSPAM
eukprot:TRINITY_DN14303_c0_g1_i1.p1 TRINITY_DN14303_c0_g1~~TRINITY_DN14303_c0_g1_i1.p1  ORF type:complete len:367 (+),score=81.48 TRINITY_DN14303_c0_g1_i1:52-1152(+)